jgi:N-acetylglucosamine-6-sulfatase
MPICRRLSRIAIGVVVALTALLARGYATSSSESAGSGEAARERPNVVVVLADDLDLASTSVMRYVQESLAPKGVTFANAFVTTPLCCPSRATLLTGQYAHNHGVRSNDPPSGGYPALDGSSTLPVWMAQAGYRTGFVGKYLNRYGSPGLGLDPREVPPGWSDWHAFTLHSEYHMYGYTLNVNGRLRHYGHRPRDYQTDVLARHAVRFVERGARQTDPFMLVVAPLAPHDEAGSHDVLRNPQPAPRHLGRFATRPLPVSPAFNEPDMADKPRFARGRTQLGDEEIQDLANLYRSRMESLLAVDDLVRRLAGALRATGELDNTIVIFTSDNGFLLGEHRQVGKKDVYEESVRVPLIVRGPGFPRGVTREQPVANIDLAPTIAEMTGVRPGLDVDGRSLAAVASNPRVHRHRALVLEGFIDRPYEALRTPRFVLVRYEAGGSELYDLRSDPHQLENLRGDPSYAGVKHRLSRRLEELGDCAGAACR